MSQVVQDPLDAGRDALRRREWADGLRAPARRRRERRAHARGPLLLGEAAMWIGHMDELERLPRARLPRLPAGGQDPARRLRRHLDRARPEEQPADVRGERLDEPGQAPARPRARVGRARLLGAAEEPRWSSASGDFAEALAARQGGRGARAGASATATSRSAGSSARATSSSSRARSPRASCCSTRRAPPPWPASSTPSRRSRSTATRSAPAATWPTSRAPASGPSARSTSATRTR